MNSEAYQEINHLLESVYGTRRADQLTAKIQEIVAKHACSSVLPNQAGPVALTEKDVILITYGDIVREEGRAPLATLNDFVTSHLKGTFNTIHILPFYPYSSDDGFSVIDYRKIDPALGTWEDIEGLGAKYKLMFDAVINHISKESEWFQKFLLDRAPYTDWFIVPLHDWDFSKVVRPRTSPLLSDFMTFGGLKQVWTTFSNDQIDLNYASPDVLLEIVDLMLFYASKGASLVRLDAIAYLWKESGTPCIHLPQTHQIIRLIRKVFEVSGINTLIITETNVPHDDNISYFGYVDPQTGMGNEAHLVYQFPLAPLVLHTFITGNAKKILNWVETLGQQGLFFNFLASHDGIGIMPARGLLNEEEIKAIVDQVIANGGKVSYKSNLDGSQTVYELNTTFFDALNAPYSPSAELDLARFMASQAIMLSLAGVPGIYYLSLFGGSNNHKAVQKTGRNRSINRQKFRLPELAQMIGQSNSLKSRVFKAYEHMLAIRTSESAFNPHSAQKVIYLDDRLFVLERNNDETANSAVLVMINVSDENFEIRLDLKDTRLAGSGSVRELFSGNIFEIGDNFVDLNFGPYQLYWLKVSG